MNASRTIVAGVALGAAALAGCGESAAQDTTSVPEAGPGAVARPRLVVLVSIDQLRADYLTRFEDLFLPARTDGKPGGFRWLMAEGAWFSDAHHDHYPTYTGPGHAVLLTGAPPATSGIVGNQWFDRTWRRVRYCVEGPGDARTQGPPSAETLLVTTVGDELETATGGRARTWSFGFKDRAAILMGGHLSDGTWWFDDERGGWTTSAAFGGEDKAPAWLRAWIDERAPDREHGTKWEFGAPAAALARLWSPPGAPRPTAFSYTLDGGKPVSQGGKGRESTAFYRAWARTPAANDYVLRTALKCVVGEGLGRDDVPDLLTVNLSTNDYIGHAFGPDSAQVLDVTVKTDRALSDFFQGLDATVPGGLAQCVFVLSADHGVAPNPHRTTTSGLPGGVQPNDDNQAGVSPQRDAAEKALDAAFGADDWVLSHVEHQVYLDPAAIQRHPGATPQRAEEIAAEACARSAGVHACFTRTQILEGRVPGTLAARAVTLGFHRRVSGDVVIVAEPQWSPVPSKDGATHGSVFPYDSHVPVIFAGFGVRPGRVHARVSTLDIAPTLAALLGVAQPSGNQGRVLAAGLR